MKHLKIMYYLQRIVMSTILSFSFMFSQAQTKSEVLTNTSVISLVKAGLDKSLIITTINNAEAKFDVSTTTLISLKKQGIPNEIINAMVEKSASGNSVSGNNERAKSSPTNLTSSGSSALSNLDPGIYYLDASNKNVQLEPSIFTSSKTGSGIGAALSYGIAKIKSKAVLSGSDANLKFSGGTATTFYFIFPKNSAGNIGNEGSQNLWISSATSPNEFVLIKFKSINTKKQKAREVVTGSYGTYSGFSSGIPDDNKVNFRSEKLSSGVYKIYFETPLLPGEYAFIHAGGSATAAGGAPAQKAFDFSITN